MVSSVSRWLVLLRPRVKGRNQKPQSLGQFCQELLMRILVCEVPSYPLCLPLLVPPPTSSSAPF